MFRFRMKEFFFVVKLFMDISFCDFAASPQNQQDSNLHCQQQNTDSGPGYRPHPYILIGAIDHEVQVCVFRRFSVSVQGAGSIGVMIAGVVGQESHAVVGGSLDAGDGMLYRVACVGVASVSNPK